MYQNDLAANYIKQTSHYADYLKISGILEREGFNIRITKSSEVPSSHFRTGNAVRDYCNTNSIVVAATEQGQKVILTAAFDKDGHKKTDRMQLWVGTNSNIETILADCLK